MPATKVPKYRCQNVKGVVFAFVEINGVRRYLGKFNTPESRQAYDRLITAWLAAGRTKIAAPALNAETSEISVLELCGRFWEHVEKYYRKPDGSATSEQDIYRQVLRTLKELCASLKVSQFGPRTLVAVRQKFIERQICRDTANKYTARVKCVFKWGVEQELVPPSVWHGLQAVAGLRYGRSEASESEGVEPVQQTHIDAIKPFVSKQVWALIKLQLFTAARPGELVKLRAADIDKSRPIWVCNLKEHKTAHLGKKRCIYIGPQAQEILAAFMVSRPTGEYLFSPVLEPSNLPHLEVVVRNVKHDIVANVGAQIVALIVNPQNRVLYLEAVSTSDAGAHALMGSVSDPRGAVEFRFYRAGEAGDYIEIRPPESPRLANVRLSVSGWSRHVHHIAMLDRSGDLMLAPDDVTLWRKLREKMTCPTLAEWGGVLMKKIHASTMLLECEVFGVPEGLRAFVLSADAQTVFDSIISNHARSMGLPRHIAAVPATAA